MHQWQDGEESNCISQIQAEAFGECIAKGIPNDAKKDNFLQPLEK